MEIWKNKEIVSDDVKYWYCIILYFNSSLLYNWQKKKREIVNKSTQWKPFNSSKLWSNCPKMELYNNSAGAE